MSTTCMRFVLTLVGLVALQFALPSQFLNAQYENGSILGTIRDDSGAAIAGANVIVTDTATAVSSEANTSSSGDYDIPQLRVCVYTVKATAPGFAGAVARNITVSVRNRQRIHLTLKVGAETTVEVSDVALQIETESSQRDQTITSGQSAVLPQLNRNYTDLLGLVTGVRQAPTAATISSNGNSLIRQGAYNVNGQRSAVCANSAYTERVERPPCSAGEERDHGTVVCGGTADSGDCQKGQIGRMVGPTKRF